MEDILSSVPRMEIISAIPIQGIKPSFVVFNLHGHFDSALLLSLKLLFQFINNEFFISAIFVDLVRDY